jgi:hypothetical protein
LGYKDWRDLLLCLWDRGEEDGWKGNRTIDYLHQRMGSNKYLILVTTKDNCQVWEINSKNILLLRAVYHNNKDVDLNKAKDGMLVLEIILAFLDNWHKCKVL